MATNLSLDNSLLNKALRVSGRRTKKAAVTEALEEYIRRREQKKILSFFGTVEPDNYDPKEFRRHS
jgi:Arc/MetJ family transcription regulator